MKLNKRKQKQMERKLISELQILIRMLFTMLNKLLMHEKNNNVLEWNEDYN